MSIKNQNFLYFEKTRTAGLPSAPGQEQASGERAGPVDELGHCAQPHQHPGHPLPPGQNLLQLRQEGVICSQLYIQFFLHDETKIGPKDQFKTEYF